MDFPLTLHLHQRYTYTTPKILDDMEMSANAPNENRAGEIVAEYRLFRCGKLKINRSLDVEPIPLEPPME